MKTPFSRMITLLRKESGKSQKEVAGDLQISQALLSHYEKGIRECGLGFVVRIADYYQVSCDYLLGRTPDKTGAIIAVDDIADNDPSVKENQMRGSVLPVLNKKLIVNSLHIIFDILQKCNHKALTEEVSTYLFLAVYAVFRQLYSANPQNPDALFSVPDYTFEPSVAAELGKTAARIAHLAKGHKVNGEEGLPPEKAPLMTPDTLSKEYPLFAASLFNLLRSAEAKQQWQ